MLIHRLKLIVPASVLVLSTAQTASGAELPTQLIECRALTSAVERLDCYDQVVDAHTATTNHASPAQMEDNSPPVAPVVVTASPESAPDLSREELFSKDGAEIRKSIREATGEEELDQIEATVAEVRKSASGQAVITLDNGQVWLQTENTRARISVNDKVTIRRRSFGSYSLYNKKTAIRVKRIS